MSADAEPPLKKPKTVLDILSSIDYCIQKLNDAKLTAVLSDDIYNPLPLIKVFIGHVKSPKELSRIVHILNDKLPLKDLHHLKRVKKAGVILCPVNYLVNIPSIQDFLERYIPELSDDFDFFREIDVPGEAPKLKSQLKQAAWSCNFHPNKYLEKLAGDDFFSPQELKCHIKYMTMAFDVAKWYFEYTHNTDLYQAAIDLKQINATIVVDPKTDWVVAAAFVDKAHPMKHSCMLAIDNVAKTQHGGAWGETKQNSVEDCTLSGFDEDLLNCLRQKYKDCTFGARKFISKKLTETSDIEDPISKEDGPYLCTGYYIYTLKEPCIMCSMGLVHARAKKIFFAFDNGETGGLKSKTKLQACTSLNHRFEVFTGFLQGL